MRPFILFALLVIALGICPAPAIAQNGPQPPAPSADEIRTLTEKAQKGDAGAQVSLAHDYYHGLGVPQDNAEALKWLRKAADQGSAEAQEILGGLYLTGKAGMPEDKTEAAKWLRKAADQGDAKAQYVFGLMYNEGLGVPQDYTEAAKWLRKAADQGQADAQHDLDVLYANGKVAQDSVKPHTWQEVPACDDKDIQQRLPSEVQARLQKDALQDPSPANFIRLKTSQYTLSLGHETDDKTNLKRICDLMIVFTGGQAPEQYHYEISVKDIGQNSYVDLQIAKGFYPAETK